MTPSFENSIDSESMLCSCLPEQHSLISLAWLISCIEIFDLFPRCGFHQTVRDQQQVKMLENVPDTQTEHESSISANASQVRTWFRGWKIFVLLPLVLALAAVSWSSVTTTSRCN